MLRIRITGRGPAATVLAVALASSVAACGGTAGPAATGATETVEARPEGARPPALSSGPGVPPSPGRLVVPDDPASPVVPVPVPGDEGQLAPEQRAAGLRAATAWVTAWARPPAGTRHDVWKTPVAALTMPEQVYKLDDIDPQNIPYTTVTGPPVVVASGTGYVEADVPTDNYPIRVTVLDEDGRWLVTQWRDAREPAEPEPTG